MSINNPNDPIGNFDNFFTNNQQGDPWQTAADIAAQIASESGTEENINPLSRKSIEDLTRVAEVQLNKLSSVSLPADTKVVTVTRADWCRKSLEVYKPFFERFGEALSFVEPDVSEESSDPLYEMLSQMLKTLGPFMVATSAGSMLGHIGLQVLGQYDLPIPRPNNDILVVPNNIDKFSEEINTSKDEVRLWVLIHEFITHAVLSTEHVKNRMESLLIDFASAFKPNTQLIEDQFNQFEDFTDFETDENINSPDAVLSMMRSPSHDLLIPQIDALLSIVLGYVDYGMEIICKNLLTDYETIHQTIWEKYDSADQADHFMENLLGLEITSQTMNRGRKFIDGVLERAGEKGLDQLWQNELDLPTIAEVDAPGLWLERIGYGSSDGIFSVPDDISDLEILEEDDESEEDS